ncbi:MAG: lytic transglycosylase domain-containing protein [Tatlockia sp.]|nr:lytic transglycosylase domain-containing protein [Tatlockia sp.]
MRISVIFCLYCLLSQLYASPAQDYLKRFLSYQAWSTNLPLQPNADFFTFIDSDSPLAQKLRNRWLYHLAHQKDWRNFSQHYKASADLNLQCLAQIAHLNEGKTTQALAEARKIWLTGELLPPVCNPLFSFMLKSENFDEKLITQRIILALDKHNLILARALLKIYKQPRFKDEQILLAIAQKPSRIAQLERGDLHDYFYLFGLKRLLAVNMKQAILHWQSSKTRQFLNESQQQSFLVQLAISKAMRNSEDQLFWFAKIKPAFYNDTLLDWQIRFALKGKNWNEVIRLVNYSLDKEKPGLQYWLARALEAKGNTVNATQIYDKIAQNRNYYGFLASMRLHRAPSFENETAVSNLGLLKHYQPITTLIKNLYLAKQNLQASRLLNDFSSELPKDDRSALVYWVANELRWYAKAVDLSDNEILHNQLSLRFPVIYLEAIKQYSHNYQIPAELIYAIIRQESGFRDNVISPAGARGLMQVMPSTAIVVAKREKIAYNHKDQLFSSHKNINIGVAYLKQLNSRYNYHPILIAAAYNAGPSQVNYWLKNHPPKEMDIWIDTLPWHETRNYLKNIIAFNTVYQYRLRQKPDLHSLLKTL